MKRTVAVWTLAAMCLSGVRPIAAVADAPKLKVACAPIIAEARVVKESDKPEGKEKVISVGRDEPVTLEKGATYQLVVSAPGYETFRKRFSADWAGVKEKSVQLERSVGPEPGKPWTADLEDKVTMKFVPIPAGEFMMGSDLGDADEQPVHRVVFKRPFWMAKTEVTMQQYEQFREVKYEPEPNEILMPRGAEYPVCYVSWDDAMAFCKWLTRKERRRGRLPEGYIYTLPTEAEWEYACRAGSTEDFAGKPEAMAWYDKNSKGKTNPVGQKKPNPWGLYDMHGNVWEWCYDYWHSYTNMPLDGSLRDDPPGEFVADRTFWGEPGYTVRWYNYRYRVVRGGCWKYSLQACRASNRFYHEPDLKMNQVGFRPVLIWYPPHLEPRVTGKIRQETASPASQ